MRHYLSWLADTEPRIPQCGRCPSRSTLVSFVIVESWESAEALVGFARSILREPNSKTAEGESSTTLLQLSLGRP
jgi:hypothetical protein